MLQPQLSSPGAVRFRGCPGSVPRPCSVARRQDGCNLSVRRLSRPAVPRLLLMRSEAGGGVVESSVASEQRQATPEVRRSRATRCSSCALHVRMLRGRWASRPSCPGTSMRVSARLMPGTKQWTCRLSQAAARKRETLDNTMLSCSAARNVSNDERGSNVLNLM